MALYQKQSFIYLNPDGKEFNMWITGKPLNVYSLVDYKWSWFRKSNILPLHEIVCNALVTKHIALCLNRKYRFPER